MQSLHVSSPRGAGPPSLDALVAWPACVCFPVFYIDHRGVQNDNVDLIHVFHTALMPVRQ